MTPLFTIYNMYTGNCEFTGTNDECVDYLRNYGGGWAALSIRDATKEEKEEYLQQKTQP